MSVSLVGCGSSKKAEESTVSPRLEKYEKEGNESENIYHLSETIDKVVIVKCGDWENQGTLLSEQKEITDQASIDSLIVPSSMLETDQRVSEYDFDIETNAFYELNFYSGESRVAKVCVAKDGTAIYVPTKKEDYDEANLSMVVQKEEGKSLYKLAKTIFGS